MDRKSEKEREREREREREWARKSIKGREVLSSASFGLLKAKGIMFPMVTL